MKVVLIQPPINAALLNLPTGLLSLASFIGEYGYEVVILDLNLEFESRNNSGDYFKMTAEEILSNTPDVLGFSVMCTNLPVALLIALQCKKLSPDLRIIFGGPEVSFDEDLLMSEFEQIDVIIRGEGELILLETLEAIESGANLAKVSGITYRSGGSIKRNMDRPLIKNMDMLPFFDFSYLKCSERYTIGAVEAGRGCPHRCTFCSTCRMWGHALRMKSGERLADEIRYVWSRFNKCGSTGVSIVHDNFLSSQKAVSTFLSCIPDAEVSWTCSSRIDVLDCAFIKKLKEKGCQGLFLGIESGSPKVQEDINKRLPLSRLDEIFDCLRASDMAATLSFIIGFPGENEQDMDATLETALSSMINNPHSSIQIHPFMLLKGSELYFRSIGSSANFTDRWKYTLPPMTDHATESELIDKYPTLFPSFYMMNRSGLDSALIEKLSILYCFLLEHAPLTTRLLLDKCQRTPVQLGIDIIEFIDLNKIAWSHPHDNKKLFYHYCEIICRYMKSLMSPLLLSAFEHEMCFWKLNYMDRAADAGASKASGPSDSYKMVSSVILSSYPFDVFHLATYLKSGKPVPEEECCVAYVSSDTIKIILLNKELYRLALLCDGNNSAQRICQLYCNQEGGSTPSVIEIEEALQHLQSHGIVQR